MNENILHEYYDCDLCIVGGGLAGSFAAISAARHGAKVVLMQDRPMFGGNCSSEIRMWIRGAQGPYNKETGLVSELEERNIHYNPTLCWPYFDAMLYGMVEGEKNITTFLNTSCMDAKVENGKIKEVTGWQLTTYKFITVRAKLFADCSGDSILAPITGAKFKHGREATSEYGETLAQEVEDNKTMGMSVLLAARETDHPVKFTPPDFAYSYPDEKTFNNGVLKVGELKRTHYMGTSGENFWWIELGGNMQSIYDSDKVRRELIKTVYGVWDHVKNHGSPDLPDHKNVDNWELEWVGFLPGKRESRRYVGEYVVTEHDLLTEDVFPDEIAYGGWAMDDHNPEGFNVSGNYPSRMIPSRSPYGLPYRALYSENIDNLYFAGRNISVSHVALSSTRVMATCSLLGQAMGTAAALAVKYDCMPNGVNEHIRELQQTLLNDGVFLPNFKKVFDKDLVNAKTNLTDTEKSVLFNGVDRQRTQENENCVDLPIGSTTTFEFDKPKLMGTLRLCFDGDLLRTTVSENQKMRVYTNKLHTGLDFKPVKTAATMVKGFEVFVDGESVYKTEENFFSLVKVPVGKVGKKIEIKWLSTHGFNTARIFSIDLI